MLNWWQSVCRSPGVVRITDIRAYGAHSALQTRAPIDLFLERVEKLVTSGTPTALNASPDIAGLYFVGLISNTENYFRETLSRILESCPISQRKSSSRDVKLGSALWYRTGRLERGAFEGMSFAAAKNIIDTCRNFFDVSIDLKSDCFALLQQFDQLCELRHCVVHSAGIMSGKNALNLQLDRTNGDTLVLVDFARFQEAAALCTALVAAFNIELFKAMANRWRDDWPSSIPGWTPQLANRYFARIWNLFHSEVDLAAGRIGTVMTRAQCKKNVLNP